MSTSDPTGSDPAPETSAAGPARMDLPTSQQMLREMTTLTGALFGLLQPPPPAQPATSPGAAPRSSAVLEAAAVPAVPLPELPVASVSLPDLPVSPETAVVPEVPTTAPLASIPLPSLPVPDLPAEPETQATEDQEHLAKDGRPSMALMNEIAFLDG